MKKLLLLLVIISFLLIATPTMAIPTESYYGNGGVYDSWNICRTSAFVERGFFQAKENGFDPIITRESFGNYSNSAYELGKEFAREYPNSIQRAEKIFYFVRDNVDYLSDDDQFGRKEFAQNADELANQIKKGRGFGDCEDYAILLAVIYKGAGYRSAIVLVPRHAAALVYLPNYNKANYFWKVNGTNSWIWAEATGKRNPLGWTPEKFIGIKDATIKEISIGDILMEPPTNMVEVDIKRTIPSESPIYLQAFPFILMVGFMFILPFFRRFR
jgi:hypothetical protein